MEKHFKNVSLSSLRRRCVMSGKRSCRTWLVMVYDLHVISKRIAEVTATNLDLSLFKLNFDIYVIVRSSTSEVSFFGKWTDISTEWEEQKWPINIQAYKTWQTKTRAENSSVVAALGKIPPFQFLGLGRNNTRRILQRLPLPFRYRKDNVVARQNVGAGWSRCRVCGKKEKQSWEWGRNSDESGSGTDGKFGTMCVY